jgi:hypothetical protein
MYKKAVRMKAMWTRIRNKQNKKFKSKPTGYRDLVYYQVDICISDRKSECAINNKCPIDV